MDAHRRHRFATADHVGTPPGRSGPRSRPAVVLGAAGVALAALLTACGSGDTIDPEAAAPRAPTAAPATSPAEPTTPPTAAASATPGAGTDAGYCRLVAELDAAGEQHFAPLEDREATEEEYLAAERSFVEAHRAEMDAVAAAAPAQIVDDVRTLLQAQRDRAGLSTPPPVAEDAVEAAEEKVQAYEANACATGEAEGDGDVGK